MTSDRRFEIVRGAIIKALAKYSKPGNDATIWDKSRWLNIVNASQEKSDCVDKIKAKEYAFSATNGELMSAETIQVMDKVSELDLSRHPARFMLKSNAGSSKNVFFEKGVTKMVDVEAKARTFPGKDSVVGLGSCEFNYSFIEPRIFTEESLLSNANDSLIDYRFWVMNGSCKFVGVAAGRGHGAITFFSPDFKEIDIHSAVYPGRDDYSRPDRFEDMVKMSEELATPFKFVRVDLYNVRGIPYFGEMTFSPGGYAGHFVDHSGRSLDVDIGKMLEI